MERVGEFHFYFVSRALYKMAYIYNVEPNTNGKVVLHTTSGDVDIELWSDQAPIACRNFVQLCMEGYYNNTIFHRIIKKMMIQGGDPTGTGQGLIANCF